MQNVCTEVTSAESSDVCNLVSIDISWVEKIRKISEVVELETKLLICGTLKVKLPHKKWNLRVPKRSPSFGADANAEYLTQIVERFSVSPR